jgi:hypothetical protein
LLLLGTTAGTAARATEMQDESIALDSALGSLEGSGSACDSAGTISMYYRAIMMSW